MSNPAEPFGWNRGSVRALIVLALVAALIVFVGLVLVVAVLRAEEQFLEQIVLVLVGAFIGALSTGVAWYFANRPPSGT